MARPDDALPSQPVTFAFFDESVNQALDTASLTAVLVPSEKYVQVRDAVLRIAFEVQAAPPNTVPLPIELHGSEMLKRVEGVSDDDRILVFEKLVNVVVSNQLEVVSVGYTNWSELGFLRQHDDKLHSLNFFGILTGLQPVLAEGLVVPVVDGLPGGILDAERERTRSSPIEPSIFRAFIASVHHHQHLRTVRPGMLSIAHYEHLVEPTFSDSAHSPLLQLADVMSYLLMVQDVAERFVPTGFKARLAPIAAKLDSSLVSKWRGKMNMG